MKPPAICHDTERAFQVAVGYLARVMACPAAEAEWLVRRNAQLISEGVAIFDAAAQVERERVGSPWEEWDDAAPRF
jgi:hypothetical protein